MGKDKPETILSKRRDPEQNTGEQRNLLDCPACLDLVVSCLGMHAAEDHHTGSVEAQEGITCATCSEL